MSEKHLICNIPDCTKQLVKFAYVTSCSHIFCKDHGQNYVKNDKVRGKCYVCDSHLTTAYDCVLTDLQPCEQYKSIILNGLTPDQIFDVAERANSFYVYQLNYRLQLKENILKAIQRQNEQEETNHKIEVFKMQRFAQDLKAECDEKIKELEYHKQKVIQLSRDNKNLQAKLEKYKQGNLPRSNSMTHSGSNSRLFDTPMSSDSFLNEQSFNSRRDDIIFGNESSKKLNMFN